MIGEKIKVIIIGGGPAGLTAGVELLKDNGNNKYDVTILEASDMIGGISRTVNYKGNRMDMGGHRFFSKMPEVNEWWNNMLPIQGFLPKDDLILGRTSTLEKGGPNPEKEDKVMLKRNRISRILFNGNFFDYPITLKAETFQNMGLATTINVGFSYIKSMLFKRKEDSLEDFYVNRFGYKLYSMFFEHYTENLWGRHPSKIDPSWGAQRVKGVSVIGVLKNAIDVKIGNTNGEVETSLIQEFAYPKYGPGQMWETAAERFEAAGGNILMKCEAVSLKKDSNQINSVTYKNQNGKEITLDADIVISSMPVKDLVLAMNDVPSKEKEIAAGLPYRDYKTVGVLLSNLKLENKTDVKTIGNIVPDNWIYIHDKGITMGRMQIYNNWSPYLVKDIENTVWVGTEFFCDEGDEMWNMSDEEFTDLAINDMIKMNMIDSKDQVLDSHVEVVKKAYPAYFDTYDEIETLIDWLNTIDNLYCVGRNGQHRYNNMDHSMMTSFLTVKNIKENIKDKTTIWEVNTEKIYHENDET